MATGDHIFVYRFGYSHHGIDCGDGKVIHFDASPFQKAASAMSGHVPTVREVALDVFASGAAVHVRPYQDGDAPQQVLERARSRLGERGYNLFQNNCEHFAVWCKTGRSESTQIDALRHASKSLTRSAPLTAVAWRAVRRLPPQYRPWAAGAALGITGASFASRYLRFRRSSAHRRES